MGAFLFPVLAFVLWEFPSMVLMSLHKLFCALTGGSFRDQFQGTWAYRILGMMTFWPAIAITGGLAAGDGPVHGLFRLLLAVEIVGTFGLLVWARVSDRGA